MFLIGCGLWYVELCLAKHIASKLIFVSFFSGIGQTYWQVIAGRAISGVGGAGMNGLVSVIIAGKTLSPNLILASHG